MDRITVNLHDALGAQLRIAAEKDLRSVSDYADILLRRNMEMDSPAILSAAAELRTLRMDPVIILRDALAEIERDTALRAAAAPQEAA